MAWAGCILSAGQGGPHSDGRVSGHRPIPDSHGRLRRFRDDHYPARVLRCLVMVLAALVLAAGMATAQPFDPLDPCIGSYCPQEVTMRTTTAIVPTRPMFTHGSGDNLYSFLVTGKFPAVLVTGPTRDDAMSEAAVVAFEVSDEAACDVCVYEVLPTGSLELVKRLHDVRRPNEWARNEWSSACDLSDASLDD